MRYVQNKKEMRTIFITHGGHNFQEENSETGRISKCTNCGIQGVPTSLTTIELTEFYLQEAIDQCGSQT